MYRSGCIDTRGVVAPVVTCYYIDENGYGRSSSSKMNRTERKGKGECESITMQHQERLRTDFLPPPFPLTKHPTALLHAVCLMIRADARAKHVA